MPVFASACPRTRVGCTARCTTTKPQPGHGHPASSLPNVCLPCTNPIPAAPAVCLQRVVEPAGVVPVHRNRQGRGADLGRHQVQAVRRLGWVWGQGGLARLREWKGWEPLCALLQWSTTGGAPCPFAYQPAPSLTSTHSTPAPRRIRTLPGHKQRVGCMAWNHHTLATGSRDRAILLRDVRSQEPYVAKLAGHRSEVRYGVRGGHRAEVWSGVVVESTRPAVEVPVKHFRPQAVSPATQPPFCKAAAGASTSPAPNALTPPPAR